jgi:hypothetical protein
LSAYRPPQRSITAQILTASRWIRGTFHLPKLHSLLDYLGKEAAFYRLTGVALDPEGPEAPFFALRRSSATIIAPVCSEEELKLESVPGAMPHPVDCLLETGMVCGLLALLPNVRVSDYLMHQESFVVLRAATFPPGSLRPPSPVEVVFVNARALVGVLERNPSVQAAERARPAGATAAGKRAGSGETVAEKRPPERRPPPEPTREAEQEPVVEEWVVTSRRD